MAVLLGLAASVAWDRPASATDWTSFGLDGARSRISTEVMGSRFAPLWIAQIPAVQPDPVYRALLASPAVADGYIATVNYGNKVRVLRERDGVSLWEAQLGDAAIASPVIDRGWLYVACLDRRMYAFRIADGHLLWKTDMGGIVYSSPVPIDGFLLVAAGAPQPRLLRVDAETGEVVWAAGGGLLVQSLDSSVVVASGNVIVGEADGRFHSFSLADGRHQWTFAAGGSPGLASPLVVGDKVYLPSGGTTGRVSAVDLVTGQPVPGWPLDFTTSLPSSNGTSNPLARHVSMSSLAAADGLIVADVRLEETVDSDGNGVADLFRLRETVVALNTTEGRVAWAVPNGSRDASDPNQIPTHGLLPTPAINRGVDGTALAVVGSTLSSTVTVLTLSSGAKRTTFSLPSPTRASPVAANGRLLVATDSGAIVALRSMDNNAPVTPAALAPRGGASSDAGNTVVRWAPSLDREGDTVTYQVRWDSDGEVLHTKRGETVTSAGVTNWRLPALAAGVTVTYAVRARDARGAWSAWSAPATFVTVAAPTVSVGATTFPSLFAALSAARPGDTVQLGRGRYPLTETMRVPDGVTLQGAGADLTVVDGRGLRQAVTLSASSASQPATLRDLTVKGAATGVATEQGTHALLQNVIIRDNTAFGIDAGASATVTVIAATLFRNDVGARSFGHFEMRNSIVTANRVGLVGNPADALASRYNDLFANTEAAYDKVVKGKGDLSSPVSFAGADSGDLRVLDGSATTDHGDPEDDFGREPTPNGSRINMGAFAGTAQAELSQSNSVIGSPNTGPVPVSTESTPVDPMPTPTPTPTPLARGPIGAARDSSGGGCTVGSASHSGEPVDAGGMMDLLGLVGLGLWVSPRLRIRRRLPRP